uniref:Uncharacterized protein n=1 Tax=Anopheles melas TaxID=34690 RepID=A0A182TY05_9DIPT
MATGETDRVLSTATEQLVYAVQPQTPTALRPVLVACWWVGGDGASAIIEPVNLYHHGLPSAGRRISRSVLRDRRLSVQCSAVGIGFTQLPESYNSQFIATKGNTNDCLKTVLWCISKEHFLRRFTHKLHCMLLLCVQYCFQAT